MALPLGAALLVAHAGAEDLPAEAAGALRRAVTFFHARVSAEGGYLWRYSDDLTLREGEVKAGERTKSQNSPSLPKTIRGLSNGICLSLKGPDSPSR